MADEKSEVKNDGGDDITLNFSAKINTAKYAARLGIKLPDDSMDATLTGEDDKAEEGSGNVTTDSAPEPVEDATISYGTPAKKYDTNNCAATAQKCKAKNPLTCRYHGAKIIAQDIENQLRASGVPGQVNVELTTVTKNRAGSEILGINISVTAPRSERKNIKAAMKKFFAQPGVEGDTDDIDYESGAFNAPLDIDSLNPNAQAKWGMGQTPPAQPAPSPAPTPAPQPKPAPAPSTPPPAAQPAPTSAPATPTPTQTPAPATQTTPPPAPKKQKKAAKKAAVGPKHPVAPPTDGSPSEEQKRKDEIAAAEKKIAGATGNDKQKLDDALKKMKDASDEMAAFEGSIGALDDAIANSTDKDVSDALKNYLDDAEKAYGDLDKNYRDAADEIDEWNPPAPANDEMSKDSIANTIAALKASGKKVSPLLDKWQKKIDSKLANAKAEIQKKFGFTQAQMAAAEGFWKKNCKAIYDGLVSGELTAATIIGNNTTIKKMLAGTRPVGANGNGSYNPIVQGSFGYNGSDIPEADGTLCFTRIMSGKANDFPNWWSGNFAVVADPKKSVLAFFGNLYDGNSNYGWNSSGNLSLLTDASLTSAVGEYVTRDALTKDLSGLPKNQLLQAMGLQEVAGSSRKHGNECHPVGGIHSDNCLAIKQLNAYWSFPSFTKKEKATIKQNGIKLYDYNGNEVDVDKLP